MGLRGAPCQQWGCGAHLASNGVVLVAVDAAEHDGPAVVQQLPIHDGCVLERHLAGFHTVAHAIAVNQLQDEAVHRGLLRAPQLHCLCMCGRRGRGVLYNAAVIAGEVLSTLSYNAEI